MTTTPTEVFHAYFDSVVAGDMDRLASLLDEEIVWHQPGAGPLSGAHKGREGVLALLGEFMARSEGSFRLAPQDVMANGDLVAVTVRFSADRSGRDPLDMAGVDVLRVADGRITEMWLFSADQQAEDTFWT